MVKLTRYLDLWFALHFTIAVLVIAAAAIAAAWSLYRYVAPYLSVPR